MTGAVQITQAGRARWQRQAAAELARILGAHPELPAIAWMVGPAGCVLELGALAEGEGRWDSEYPRDAWRLGRLGITGTGLATLQFGGISQPWLKDLAKRWTRWRISTGLSMSSCYHGVRAVTRFAAFAAQAGIQGLHQAGRDLLERYLARLHRELGGNRRALTECIGELNTFLLAIRRHGWDATVRKFAGARSVDDLIAKTGQRTHLIDPYSEHMHRRWHEGERNATQLFREIQQLGYPGGELAVQRYLRQFRHGCGHAAPGHDIALGAERPHLPDRRARGWEPAEPDGTAGPPRFT